MDIPHRISAGALVIQDNRVLLVKHCIPGKEDFWVPPGGGAEGDESLKGCAERECFEETGLRVRAHKIAYIEEFFDDGRRICKHWIKCEPIGGEINFSNVTEEELDIIREARFVSRKEIIALNVFPRLMQERFWDDYAAGFPNTHHIISEY